MLVYQRVNPIVIQGPQNRGHRDQPDHHQQYVLLHDTHADLQHVTWMMDDHGKEAELSLGETYKMWKTRGFRKII